jgi:pentatricopeptide repeat protein
MMQAFQSGNENSCPDTDALNLVLHCWLESASLGNPLAAEKAHSMLTRLRVLLKENNSKLKSDELVRLVNLDTFNIVLACWANSSNQPDAIEHAENLFNDMQMEGFSPDLESYTSMMKLLSKSGDLVKAETLYKALSRNNNNNNNNKTKISGILLSGWSRHKGAEAAEIRLQHFKNEQVANTILYSIVMSAFAKARRPEKAEQLLMEMIAHSHSHALSKNLECCHSRPDLACFEIVLNAWTKSPNPKAAERAESVLTRLWQCYENGIILLETKPSISVYHKVISCWTRSKYHGAAAHAEKLLRDMLSLHAAGSLLMEEEDSNKVTLAPAKIANAVLRVWAERGNAEQADKLLHSLIDLGGTKNYDYVDAISFLIVLDAWSSHASSPRRAGLQYQARRRTHFILTKLVRRLVEAGDLNIPSSVTVNRIIQYCAKSLDQEGAPDTAHSLLRHFQSTNSELLDTVSYNTVMSGWAELGNVVEVDGLLNELLGNYGTTRASQKNLLLVWPNAQSFNIALKAWSRSRSHADDVVSERVESILAQMIELSNGGLANAGPTIVTYNTVLSCLSKSGAAERAEEILSQMLVNRQTNTTTAAVRPDRISYVMAMQAWASKGRVDGVEKVLHQMQTMSNLQPDVRTYCALILAWASSGRSDSLEKVEALFEEMKRRFQAGDTSMKPNEHAYHIVMTALAKQGKAERVEEYYLRDSTLQPTILHYNVAILAWSKNAVQSEEAVCRAELLLQEMQSLEIVPNTMTFINLLKTVDNSSVSDKLSRAQHILSLMDQSGVQPDNVIWALIKKLSFKDESANIV